jgi:hypothetical protein
MMASKEDNPGPPGAQQLMKLPSNNEIVRPCNADVCLLILQAVLSQGAHHPGSTSYCNITALLWENLPVITDPLFGRFQEWSPTQVQRNMKDRAATIIGHYSAFKPDEVPHPTQLQQLALQLKNEIAAIAVIENAHREMACQAAESWQAANAQHEGALGLVSTRYGATMHGVDPSVHQQNENASALLAINPCLQNNQVNPIWAQVPPAPHNGSVGVIGGGVSMVSWPSEQTLA